MFSLCLAFVRKTRNSQKYEIAPLQEKVRAEVAKSHQIKFKSIAKFVYRCFLKRKKKKVDRVV